MGSETLWSIAKKVNEGRPGTTAQMAWALYRSNPDSFDGSPNKIKPKAVLNVPDNAFVLSVGAAQAYASLTAKPTAPVAAAPAPVPAVTPPRPAVPAVAAGGPVVSGVGLTPLQPGEPYQWLAVGGSGFAPGAVLELGPAGKAGAVKKPQSVREGRIEYAAKFPQKAARWQLVVRNPDGRRSAPYAFEAGAAVTLTLAAPSAPGVPVVSALTAAETAAAPLATPVAAPTASSTPFARSAEDAESRHLAEVGGAEAVYKYLSPMDERYAGDVDYDYRLGTAALDTGRFSQAIFVLQRAVAMRPSFSGARMELARAYYAQGDNESARREFDTLAQENPPPEAQRAIAEYQAAIDRKASVYQQQFGGYVELASGFDTNANGAPDTQTFLGFVLDSRNQATSSGYYGLGLGGNASYPFAPSWRLVGTGLASYRGNPDASFVDSQVLRLGGGVEWRPGAVELSLLPSYTNAMLDGNDNHHVMAVDTAATWHLAASQVSLNLRWAQQRFVDTLSTLDTDTLVYGLAAQYPIPSMPRMQLLGALTAGKDDAVESTSPFSRKLTGGRIGAIWDLGNGHALMASVASLNADYDGTFFGMDRKDEQLGGQLGYEWGGLRAQGWVLRGQVNYVDNSSSVALYDYKRTDAGISVRREFR